MSNRSRRQKPEKISSNQNQIKISRIWQDFCNNSTIDGMDLLLRHQSTIGRTFLLMWFFLSTIVATYQGYSCFNEYLKYDISTTVTYDTLGELNFPAITFCNSYIFRRSVLGLEEFFIKYISDLSKALMSSYPNRRMLENTKRACTLENANKTKFVEYLSLLQSMLHEMDLNILYQFDGLGSLLSVLKCWWNEMETNCTQLFVNHYFQDQFCFTYNQKPEYLDMGGSFKAFGKDENSSQNNFVTNPSKNVFQVLLHSQQDEYCLYYDPPAGAGFRVLVHDNKSQTSFEIQSGINLSPGFEYSVSMKPIVFDSRNFSEWLGRCTSYVYNFMKPNDREYTQLNCIWACFAEKLFNNCSCFLTRQDAAIKNNITAKYFNTSVEKLKSCTFDLTENHGRDYECLSQVVSNYMSTNPDVTCPQCGKPCLYTKYEYVVSSKKLSASTIFALRGMSERNGSSEKYIKRNLLLAKFSLESLTLINVRELQSVTSRDLFINLSNIFGLYLGISVITLYELTHYVIMTFCIFVLNRVKKKSENKKKIVFVKKPVRLQVKRSIVNDLENTKDNDLIMKQQFSLFSKMRVVPYP